MSQAASANVPAAARLRLLVGVSVVAGFAALAIYRQEPAAQESLEEMVVAPLPKLALACALQAADALANARTLEQMAKARWERVPFALEEAPRAAVQMAEAEACYAAAHDRAGRLRAAELRSAYASEVERRFVRARLLLRVALREERAERVRAEVAALLALLSSAPASATDFRRQVEQLARDQAATAYESAALKESTP